MIGRGLLEEPKTSSLPDGVTLTRTEAGDYELRILAPDADELIWRLHDLVTMIQNGQFDEHLGPDEA